MIHYLYCDKSPDVSTFSNKESSFSNSAAFRIATSASIVMHFPMLSIGRPTFLRNLLQNKHNFGKHGLDVLNSRELDLRTADDIPGLLALTGCKEVGIAVNLR